MSPVRARPNAADRANRNAMTPRKLTVAQSRTSEDVSHIGLAKTGPRDGLAARLISCCNLVCNIFVIGSPSKVAGIYASRVVATVQSVGSIGSWRSVCPYTHLPVGSNRFSDSTASLCGKLTVTLRAQFKRPHNAFVSRRAGSCLNEAFLLARGRLHSIQPTRLIKPLIVRAAVPVRQMLLAAICNRTYALISHGCLPKGSAVRRGLSASNTPYAAQNLLQFSPSATLGGRNAY